MRSTSATSAASQMFIQPCEINTTAHQDITSHYTMLPPIDDSVLQSNPRFAALHTTLTNNILNPNGSTKNHPSQKDRDAVTEVPFDLSSLNLFLTLYRHSSPPKYALPNHSSSNPPSKLSMSHLHPPATTQSQN